MIEIVGKIGSMALINKQRSDIDYEKFWRIGSELKPNMVWVTSGATEIGRLDYIKRTGRELGEGGDEVKADYASQGQAILMQTYRNYINPRYSVRQVLVEHHHFNSAEKKEHIKSLLNRCASQNAVPIVNYNDAVCFEENRKNEIKLVKSKQGSAFELVDNDETAAQIACLVGAKILVILSGVEGIYKDPANPATLIRQIQGSTKEELTLAIDRAIESCNGTSRTGAGGARAKLEYIKPAALAGTRVIIASADYSISDIIKGKVPSTEIMLTK